MLGANTSLYVHPSTGERQRNQHETSPKIPPKSSVSARHYTSEAGLEVVDVTESIGDGQRHRMVLGGSKGSYRMDGQTCRPQAAKYHGVETGPPLDNEAKRAPRFAMMGGGGGGGDANQREMFSGPELSFVGKEQFEYKPGFSYNDHERMLCEELKKLRPLKVKVEKLEKELRESHEINDQAKLYETKVVSLVSEVSLKEQEVDHLQSQLNDYAVSQTHSDNELKQEISTLRGENAHLKLLRDETDGSETTAKQSSASAKLAQEVISLQRQLKQKENEVQTLKIRVATDGQDSTQSKTRKTSKLSSSRSKSTSSVLGDDHDTEIHEDLTQQRAPAIPPRAQPDDGRGKELASLKHELAEKEAKIALLTQQVQKMEETSGRVAQILEHSKMQSGTIKNLKEQLSQTEVYCYVFRSASSGWLIVGCVRGVLRV